MLVPSLLKLDFNGEKSRREELLVSALFLPRSLKTESDSRNKKKELLLQAQKIRLIYHKYIYDVFEVAGKRRRSASLSLNDLTDSRKHYCINSADELYL